MAEQTNQKPTLLITGASGLIGSALLQRAQHEYKVIALDIVEPKVTDASYDFVHCDLSDEQSVRQSLEQVQRTHGLCVASVVHLAAYYDFSGGPSPLYEQLTIEGTRRLLTALDEFEVEQFVFSSSLLVMAPAQSGELLDETSPTRAEWEYPKSKLATEAVVRQTQGDIPAVILRIAGVYAEDCHSIPIAQQIRRIYEKDLESYFFPGNSEHGQSFVHLDDVIDCLMRTVAKRSELDHTELLLIGEPEVLSYGTLQHQIGELLHGTQWPTIRIPKTVAKAGAWMQNVLSSSEQEPFIKPWMVDQADAHYPVNPARARTKLGWQPRHRLADTLPAMIDRLKENPQQWYEMNNLPVPSEVAQQ
jgi:nucleoside-diphosphate-sugar epimerase